MKLQKLALIMLFAIFSISAMQTTKRLVLTLKKNNQQNCFVGQSIRFQSTSSYQPGQNLPADVYTNRANEFINTVDNHYQNEYKRLQNENPNLLKQHHNPESWLKECMDYVQKRKESADNELKDGACGYEMHNALNLHDQELLYLIYCNQPHSFLSYLYARMTAEHTQARIRNMLGCYNINEFLDFEKTYNKHVVWVPEHVLHQKAVQRGMFGDSKQLNQLTLECSQSFASAILDVYNKQQK